MMFKKIKELLTLPKVFLELSEVMLKLGVQHNDEMKTLEVLSAKHIKEMCRIEESIKFRIQDIEQLYPKLRDFVEREETKLNRINSKLDEIERKITNMDYGR